MSLFRRPFMFSQEKSINNPFKDFYFSLENTEQFPFNISLRNLQYIEGEIETDADLLFCCLEDSIFSSLQATYYEEMLIALTENVDVSYELIHKFHEAKNTRDNLILRQAQTHVDYLIRGGMCPGCDQCDNHKDVDELLSYYQNGDINFFIKLYLGMQSIHLGMEELIFNYLPTNPDKIQYINRETVLSYRSSIFSHADEQFSKLFLGT